MWIYFFNALYLEKEDDLTTKRKFEQQSMYFICSTPWGVVIIFQRKERATDTDWKARIWRRLYAKSTGRLEYISHSYQQHKEPSKNLSGQLQVQQLLFAVFWNHLAPKGNPVQNKRRKQWLHVTLGISNFPFMKCYMPQTVQLFIRLNCNSSHASCKMKEAKEGNFQYTVGWPSKSSTVNWTLQSKK